MQLTPKQKEWLAAYAKGWYITSTPLLKQISTFEFNEPDDDLSEEDFAEQAALVKYIGSFVPDAETTSIGIRMSGYQWRDTTEMLYQYHCLGRGTLPSLNPHAEAEKWLTILNRS